MSFVLPNKKIKIVSTGKNKFSGLSSYPRTGKTLSTELGKSGLYNTGLTPEEQSALEEMLMLKTNSLSKKPADENGTNFWANLEIKLNAKGNNELNLEDPIQYIKYKALLASSKVCNSPLEKHKWPAAEWMIVDDEQVAEVEAVEIDKEVEAIEIFNELSEEDKKGLLKLYGKRGLEKSKPELIKSTLYKELKKDPIKFVKTAKDKSLKTRVLVEDFLIAKIVTRNGNYFKNGDDPIGNSMEEVISYFEDPRNQSVKIALQGKLKKA